MVNGRRSNERNREQLTDALMVWGVYPSLGADGSGGIRVKEAALVLGILSGLVGVLATIALMKGSAPVPWEIQSWKGQSEAERAHRASTASWTKAGLAGLVTAFLFSGASAIASYLS